MKCIDVFCSFQRTVGLFCFPQVVQKQTLGDVENSTVVDGDCVRNVRTKIIQILSSFFKLQSIMSGTHFETQCTL